MCHGTCRYAPLGTQLSNSSAEATQPTAHSRCYAYASLRCGVLALSTAGVPDSTIITNRNACCVLVDVQVLARQLLSSSPDQRPSCEEVLALPFLQPAVAAARQLAASKQVCRQPLLCHQLPWALQDTHGVNRKMLSRRLPNIFKHAHVLYSGPLHTYCIALQRFGAQHHLTHVLLRSSLPFG
jgi:hypothetical protein